MKIAFFGFTPVELLGIKTALVNRFASTELVFDQPASDHPAASDSIDLVVIDPTTPTLNVGLTACRELKSRPHPPLLVAFSPVLHARDAAVLQLSGVDSFVANTEPVESLAAAIKALQRGEKIWILGRTPNRRPPIPAADGLTPREEEVLVMLVGRYTNKQIARALSISLNTAKNHSVSVLRKLGVSRRTQLFVET
ncbi:LuxR C-terminal-related transcriptional regulator [Amycolatopsis sp. NPDC004378]